jgi:hypothetical protein
MKKIILILLLFYCSSLIFAQHKNTTCQPTQNSELVNGFISIITPLLKGKDNTIVKSNISPEAYIIINNSYESLFELLMDPLKKKNITVGEDLKIKFLRLILQEENKNAYMILETNSDNKASWHSILFRMNENNDWQILSWHKS